MQSRIESYSAKAKRRVLAAVLAVATVVTAATLNFAMQAKAAAPASAVAPLDDNSVAALTTLDHAMETLAARVTPAVVNVTVASKSDG